jgi:hypothetical protein
VVVLHPDQNHAPRSLPSTAGRVVVLFWEAGDSRVLAEKGDNCEVIFGIGEPGCLRPQQFNDLDVVAPAVLVAKGLESDLGTPIAIARSLPDFFSSNNRMDCGISFSPGLSLMERTRIVEQKGCQNAPPSSPTPERHRVFSQWSGSSPSSVTQMQQVWHQRTAQRGAHPQGDTAELGKDTVSLHDLRTFFPLLLAATAC